MSEHTKGPWTWNGGYLVSYIPDKFSASGYQDFEIIVDDGSAHGEYDVVLNPDSANARLIAAAPELLEALEAMFGENAKVQVIFAGNPIVCDYVQKQVFTAIARAKGN